MHFYGFYTVKKWYRDFVRRLLTSDRVKGLEDDVVFYFYYFTSYNALDYYIVLDSFYNIKISRIFDLWLIKQFCLINTLVA